MREEWSSEDWKLCARTAFIAAAGGFSSRFGNTNKLLADLNGLPVFLHVLRTASELFSPEHIVLVVPDAARADFRNLLAGFPCRMVSGGATRTESVRNALAALSEETELNYVAIHDAARPQITREQILRCLRAAKEHRAALLAHRICDTVKRASSDLCVEETIPREPLWAAETPQIFELALLRTAYVHACACDESLTDDAQVVERFTDVRPYLVENHLPNPKITFGPDLDALRA